MKEREYIDAMLEAGNLKEEAEICAEFLQNPVVVISPSLAIITNSTKRVIPDHTWQNAVHRGYITLEFGNSLNNWDSLKDKDKDYMTVSTISTYRRRFFRLLHKGTTVGYLNVGEVDRSLDEISEDTVTLVCHFLTRSILTHQHTLQSSGNRPEDIMTELLQGSYVDRLHYLERISGTVFETLSAHRIACLSVKGLHSYNAGEDSLREEISSIIPGSIAAVLDRRVYILMPVYDSMEKNTKVKDRLNKWLNKKHIPIGISDVFYDLYQTGKYKTQAEYALTHIMNKTICFYEEVIVQDLIEHIPTEQRNYYCCMSIRQIAQYDKEHNTKYIPTLKAWLVSGTRLKETSYILNMHRNSVSYRLQKIQDSFSIDLSDSSMYLSWLMSCIILSEPQKNNCVELQKIIDL